MKPIQHTCCPRICNCCPDCIACKNGVPTNIQNGVHVPLPDPEQIGTTHTFDPEILAALGYEPGTLFTKVAESYLGEDGEWHKVT